jgi:hypothetical protein
MATMKTFLLLDGIVRPVGRARPGTGPEQALVDDEQQRRRDHRDGDHDRQQLAQRLVHFALADRGGEDNEGEFAALGEDEGHVPGRTAGQAGQPADQQQRRELDGDESERQAENQRRLIRQQSEAQVHADRREEQPEQDALEGLDLGFQLVAEFGVRQQQAGEEGAERHRQAHHFHERGRGHDDEQTCRSEYLVAAESGNEAENGAQQITPSDEQADNGEQRHEEVRELRLLGAKARAQDRNDREDRDHGEILEQQDGKRGAAVTRRQLFLLGEELQHKRRRRQGERETDDDRRRPGQAQPRAGEGDDDGGDGHLGGAETEDRMTHDPQARGLQLEADNE